VVRVEQMVRVEELVREMGGGEGGEQRVGL
jgi:hypothetical protein